MTLKLSGHYLRAAIVLQCHHYGDLSGTRTLRTASLAISPSLLWRTSNTEVSRGSRIRSAPDNVARNHPLPLLCTGQRIPTHGSIQRLESQRVLPLPELRSRRHARRSLREVRVRAMPRTHPDRHPPAARSSHHPDQRRLFITAGDSRPKFPSFYAQSIGNVPQHARRIAQIQHAQSPRLQLRRLRHV